jgi:hypothetical protein
LFQYLTLNYLTFGERKCVPQVQSAIHVGERECTEKLFIWTPPGFHWSIHFIYLFFFPPGLNILFNLLEVLNLEGTLSIKGRGLESKLLIKLRFFVRGHTCTDITEHNISHPLFIIKG